MPKWRTTDGRWTVEVVDLDLVSTTWHSAKKGTMLWDAPAGEGPQYLAKTPGMRRFRYTIGELSEFFDISTLEEVAA